MPASGQLIAHQAARWAQRRTSFAAQGNGATVLMRDCSSFAKEAHSAQCQTQSGGVCRCQKLVGFLDFYEQCAGAGQGGRMRKVCPQVPGGSMSKPSKRRSVVFPHRLHTDWTITNIRRPSLQEATLLVLHQVCCMGCFGREVQGPTTE